MTPLPQREFASREAMGRSPGREAYRLSVQNVFAFCLFETAFFFAYQYAMSSSHEVASPFWLPDSLLTCALLLAPLRWWWLFVLAPLPIRLLVAVPEDVSLWFLLATFAIDSAKGMLTAALLRHFTRNPIRFETVRDFIVYCLFAVLLVPAVAASFGAAVRESIGYDYWPAWEQWFLGNALAQLVITPAIFYWILAAPWNTPSREVAKWVEGTFLIAGLALSAYVAFEAAPGTTAFTEPRLFAPVPFLFWAAIRFGMFGATGAIAVLSFFAIAATGQRVGALSGVNLHDSNLALQYSLLLRVAPFYLVAVLVEQRHAVEQVLRESENRFRNMANTAPVLIWMSGTDKLCEFFNQSWLDFTGRTIDEERGNGWADGVHAADLQRCLATYNASFDSRQPFEMEYRLRRYDGEYRWIVDKGIPRYSPNGDFLGYIGSAIDITDRRTQELALRDSEERYREVVDSQTDFVCRYLPDTTLTFVNEAYCRNFGRKREDLIGRKFLELLPEPAREITLNRIASIASRREPGVWEHELPLPDGSIGWQQWVNYPLFGPNGELEEFQAIGHDITDRKQAEEATRMLAQVSRLAVVGELTAMIAHEVNQPLGAILSNAEAAELLLESGNPPLDDIREILADIRKDDLRADNVIRRIRALLRKQDMEMQPLDLNELVADVARLTSGDALRQHVQVSSEFAAVLPPIWGDRSYLQQVLLNLIVNAMDAMNDTPEMARQIRLQTSLNDAQSVEVTVTDSGHGIPADQTSSIFDTLFTTKADGMGLGLSIARSIIELHRGRIWVDNNSGGGATFHVILRTVEAVEGEAQNCGSRNGSKYAERSSV